MTFNELQEKVLALWNSAPVNSRGYYVESEFLSFLNHGGRHQDMPEVGVEWHQRDGGGEGGAEDCYAVISVGGIYYEISYSYRSHEGYDFDYATVREVQRVERMAVFYE